MLTPLCVPEPKFLCRTLWVSYLFWLLTIGGLFLSIAVLVVVPDDGSSTAPSIIAMAVAGIMVTTPSVRIGLRIRRNQSKIGIWLDADGRMIVQGVLARREFPTVHSAVYDYTLNGFWLGGNLISVSRIDARYKMFAVSVPFQPRESIIR